MNSIGNLILHLCGNLRQWIVAGIRQGRQPLVKSTRERGRRADPEGRAAAARLEDVVAEGAACPDARRGGVAASTLVHPGFEVNGPEAILDSSAALSRAHAGDHSPDAIDPGRQVPVRVGRARVIVSRGRASDGVQRADKILSRRWTPSLRVKLTRRRLSSCHNLEVADDRLAERVAVEEQHRGRDRSRGRHRT